jgi:hypothetical protein
MRAQRRLEKKYWVPPLILLVLFLGLAIALDPIVEWQTRERLKMLEPRYQVTFENASLHPLRLKYVLEGLKIERRSAGGDALPYVQVERLEAGLYGRELLHLHLVLNITVDKPRLNLIAAKQETEQQLDPKIPDLSEKLAEAIPLTVDRIQVRDAAVLFTDKTKPEFPNIWVHKVDATLENLSTRAALARGEPTALAVSGTLQESGELSAFLTADPLAKGLFFAGRASIANFELKELSKTMASETGVSVSEGTLDLFAEFDCRAGKLEGGIKPVLKNIEVVKGKPGLGNAVKAVLADAAVNVLSDRVGDRDAVATVIPLRGDITSPGVQLWPAVIGVIRNAFVIGVSESYARLPPVEDAKANPVKQVIEGLDKKNSPKARPEPGRN